MSESTSKSTKKPTPKKKIEVSAPKFPVTFEQFKKNPIAAVSFCMLIAVGYLYYDQKDLSSKTLEESKKEAKELKEMVLDLQEKYRRSDSMMSAANSKILVLQQLNKIPSE
jgi:hypothetical protein